MSEDQYGFAVIRGRGAQRKALDGVELALLTGEYERLSDRRLRDLINDLTHEQYRRFSK